MSNRIAPRQYRNRGNSQVAKVGVLAALFCIVAVLAISLHLSSRPSEAKSPWAQQAQIEPGMAEIIVPLQSIPPGATLEANMFHRVRKPALVVTDDIVLSLDDIKGLYSRGMLVAEQPIHRDLLTTLQPVNALTASIPHGYRAIAISVDATSSVEGWAQPGARVDVIWVTKHFGAHMAYVVVPNAKVLSANKKAEGARVDGQGARNEIPTTVTLLLSVRDALRVRLAALNGRLALVLRGLDSDSSTPGSPISEGSLFNLAPKVLPNRVRNIVDVKVRDRRTGEVETLKFEDGNRVVD